MSLLRWPSTKNDANGHFAFSITSAKATLRIHDEEVLMCGSTIRLRSCTEIFRFRYLVLLSSFTTVQFGGDMLTLGFNV
jgi:hypothetical protein